MCCVACYWCVSCVVVATIWTLSQYFNFFCFFTNFKSFFKKNFCFVFVCLDEIENMLVTYLFPEFKRYIDINHNTFILINPNTSIHSEHPVLRARAAHTFGYFAQTPFDPNRTTVVDGVTIVLFCFFFFFLSTIEQTKKQMMHTRISSPETTHNAPIAATVIVLCVWLCR